MRPAHLWLLLLMNLCWAAVYCAYKLVGQELSAEGMTGVIVTLRFGLAGLVLLACWRWLPGPTPRGKDLAVTCGMGVMLYVLGQRLQVYGNQIGTAGNSAVLMALEPLLVSVAAALFLREHIGPRRLAGFLMGLAGVAALNQVWSPDFKMTGLAASTIFVSSFICESGYSVLGKPIVQRASVMKMLAISLLAGTAVNLLIDGPATIHAAKALSPRAWWLLGYLAVVCTAVCYSLWFLIIRDCPISVAALTVFAQSVFGVLMAAMWLGEKLHWGHLAGSLVIVAGLALGLSRQVSSGSKRGS